MSASARPRAIDSPASSVEDRKLSTLLEVGRTLLTTPELRSGLVRTLEILGDHRGVVRSTVVLLDQRTGDVLVEASAGAIDHGTPAQHRLGGGVTDAVMHTGVSMVVPQVTRESAPLNPVTALEPAEELTYISVPIPLDGQTVGALGIDLRHEADHDYETTATFLRVVSTMIAQAMKIYWFAETDRQGPVGGHSSQRFDIIDRDGLSNPVPTAPELPAPLQIAQACARTDLSLQQATEAFEKHVLQDALKNTRGKRAKAARLLSTTGRVFNYKVRKYRIDWRRFRE